MAFEFDSTFPQPDADPLISRLRRRADGEAWGGVYKRLYDAIHRVLLNRLRPGLGVDPEDLACSLLTDEIMGGLEAGKWPELRHLDDLLALACRMAGLRAIDLIRRVERRRESALPEGWENLLGSVAAEELEGGEIFEQLLRRLDPPPQRPALFRSYFAEGLTYQEIADRHGMSVGVVCSHFSRGLNKLRELSAKQLRGGENE